MISKRVPVEEDSNLNKIYDFLKQHIRGQLDDSMAEEAKVCFDFATKLFKQMMEMDK